MSDDNSITMSIIRDVTKAEQEHWRKLLAQAWDSGHRHRWRRGPDGCDCYAYTSTECGCGRYGTGELLSLKDNPFGSSDDRD